MRFLTSLFLLAITLTAYASDPFPGRCVSLNGTVLAAEAPSAPDLDLSNGAFTIEAWIKGNMPPGIGFRPVAAKTYTLWGTTGYELGIGSATDNQLNLRLYNGMFETQTVSAGPDLNSDGLWHHVAAVCDAVGNLILYVDGQMYPVGTAIEFSSADGNLKMGDYFEGSFDELCIWNTARTTEQIRESAHLTYTGSEAGLVAYWQFNEEWGPFYDSAGDHDATWIGAGSIISLAPVGGGTSASQIITSTGAYPFAAPEVNLDYTSFSGQDTVVVTRLDLEPNQLPWEYENFVSQHWIVNRFGTGTFITDITLSIAEDLTPSDESNPARLLLSRRASNSSGNWSHEFNGSAANAALDQASFSGLDSFSQLFVSRDPRPGIVSRTPGEFAHDVMPDANLQLIFDVPVFAGTGSITIRKYLDGTWSEEIPASSVTIVNSQVTIDPLTILDLQSTYYVTIDSLAFHDASDTYFPGLYNPDEWFFHTVDQFTEIDPGIPGSSARSLSWGDYDNDGWLDIGISGYSGQSSIRAYFNSGGSFDYEETILANYAISVWGDYDNDSDLDLYVSSGEGFLENIYGSWYLTDGDFSVFLEEAAHWGDHDNDGDLDLIVTGSYYPSYIAYTVIYINSDGEFSDILTPVPYMEDGTVRWGDYDNDGDLDLVITGFDDGHKRAYIFRNDQGTFTNINADIPQYTQFSSSSWGDYDCDGDLDLALLGGGGDESLIMRNDAGIFVDIGADLPNAITGSVSWGDYDNDGDLDLLLTATVEEYVGVTQLYQNVDNVFILTGSEILQLAYSKAAWGDYDNDGDLDFVLAGATGPDERHTRIYRNNTLVANTPPSAPSSLSIAITAAGHEFTWGASTDLETPSDGLTYNLQIGTPDYPVIFKSGMQGRMPQTNQRLVAEMGNVMQNTVWTLNNDFLNEEPYYKHECRDLVASVQAIDNCWTGSEMAFDTLRLNPSIEYLDIFNDSEMNSADMLSWEIAHINELASFQVQISGDIDFSSILIDELFDFNMPRSQRDLTFSVPLNSFANYVALHDNNTYYWRMRPIYNDKRRYTSFSEVPGSFTLDLTNSSPQAPFDGFVPANDEVVSSLTPTIAWDNGYDPDPGDHPGTLHYVIQLDTVVTFATIQYEATTADGVTHADVSSGLLSGYRYFYRIKTVADQSSQSDWSSIQSFLTIMPPQNVILTSDGQNLTLSWDPMFNNTRDNLVYTIYSCPDPYALFPDGWQLAAVQLTVPTWSEPLTEERKFYRVTVGSGAALTTQENPTVFDATGQDN